MPKKPNNTTTPRKNQPKATEPTKANDAKEIDARKALLEDLFYDFHRSRAQIYRMNFVRGVFFGFGSVLGATVLIAAAIWLLGQFADFFPALADFLNHLIDTMQRRR